MKKILSKKKWIWIFTLCAMLSALCGSSVIAGSTTNFGWNYGTKGQAPWWDVWTGVLQSIDTELYNRTNIPGFTADTSPTSDDLLWVVNDPSGSPTNKKVTIENLFLSQGIRRNVANFNYFAGEAGNTTMTAKYGTGFGFEASRDNEIGDWVTSVGFQSLMKNKGMLNTGVGARTLHLNETGVSNTSGGVDNLYSSVSASYNSSWGEGSLLRLIDGQWNAIVGYSVLDHNLHGNNNSILSGADGFTANLGSGNSGVGNAIAYENVNGDYISAFGYGALYKNLGSNAIGLGAFAGYWDTAGNVLYIDGLYRSSLAEGKTNSIIYGVMDAVPANQILFLNAQVTVLSLKVGTNQVVGARVIDARIDDAINSGDATTDGVIDALRDAMIAYGLIAASP